MKYILLLLIGLSCSGKAARSYIVSTNNPLPDGSPSKAIDLRPYLLKDSIAQYNDTFDMSSLDVPSYKIIQVNPFSDTVKVENDLLGIESNYDTILNKNDTIYLVIGDRILKSPAVPLYDTIKTIVQYIDTDSNIADIDVHWRYVYEVRILEMEYPAKHVKYLGLDKKELPKNFLIIK
jgi:hypothetical protein